jgi:hypothetical protein
MSLVGRSTQFYSRFDPRSIGDLLMWLDAADSNTFTLSGNSVTQWRDKGPFLYHATPGVSPTKSGNGVVFNGTNQYLTSTLSASVDTTTGQTAFVVASVNTTLTLTMAVLGSTVTLGRAFQITRSTSSSAQFGTTSTRASSPRFANLSNFRVCCMGQNNGISSHCTVNGSDPGTTQNQVITAAGSSTLIGAAGPATFSNYFNGTIHEIIIFNNWLGSNDRRIVDGYLMNKWDIPISDVSFGFPYRRDVPVMRAVYPVDFPGCTLWLDGADSNSMVLSGSSVTTWLDKSTSGNHASNGVSPTYNGSNGVVFNGTTQYLVTPTPVRAPTVGETIFAVITPTAPASSTVRNFAVLGSALVSTTNRFFGWINSSTTARRVAWVRGTTTVHSSSYPSQIASNVRVLLMGNYISNVILAGSNFFTVSVNRTAQITLNVVNASSSFATPSTSYVGAHYVSSISNFFQGTIHELLVYQGTSNAFGGISNLTSNQATQIQEYLSKKWGTLAPGTNIGTLRLNARFVPVNIRTNACVLWLDAADPTTITLAGTTVTGWQDKSSNGPRTLTQVGSPQYVQSSLLNKLNCVSFSSSSSFFWSFTQAQPFTVFAVTAQLSAVSDVYSFILEPNTSTAPVILFAPNPNPPGVLVIASGGTQLARNPPVEYYSGIAGVVTAVFSGASSLIGWNGTFTTGSVGAGTWGGLYLGRDWSGAFVDQQVGEVLFYSGVMPIQQRQQVEGYLAWKWGFRSQLPSTHPYRNVKLY